jgi:hypothetical protein
LSNSFPKFPSATLALKALTARQYAKTSVLGYFDGMSILLDGQLLIDEIIFGQEDVECHVIWG